MKKMLLPAAAFFAVVALTGCVSLDPPRIAHTGTDFTPLSFQEVRADSHFSIKNNNPIALQGEIEYELIVNGKSFTTGRSSRIEVGGTGQSTFTLSTRIDLVKVFGVAADLANAISAGRKSVPYQLNGKFRSELLQGVAVEAPVSASGEIPLPKSPDKKDVEDFIRRLIK